MVNRRSVSTLAGQRGSSRDRVAPAPFGDLVRHFRIVAGLTQEELAARATISARAVSDLERGERRRPQRDTLRLLADALNLTDEERERFESAARSPTTDMPRLVPRDPPNNLPAAMTPLVGRERDLAAIVGLLGQPTTRLVTITGGGGVGKTRIALDAMALPLFPDGTFFISLAALRDPSHVLAMIAQTFGLTERGTQGVRESLVAYLGRKRLLLVLDNFEHLIPAAVPIADLLATCGALKILVTSRAALHLRGEHEYRLRPLALPDPRDADDMGRVRRSPAVELFMQRATAVNRDFVLTPTNTRAIVDLCARLDGLPLALELAAARTRVLPLAELLARLEHRFSVLTDGAHDLPERQQTMRRAIDWSYDLLAADEQQLFRRLAAFAGGCTLEAAEAVGGVPKNCPINLLSGISSLVDKSLVQADVGVDATRFTMLETVREYGLERLEAVGEAEAVRRALAAYFLALATVEPGIVGVARAEWLARLDAEHENIRAALTWARDRDEAETGLRLAAALWRFWFTRGHLREGRAWIEAMLALDHTGAAAPFARAEALCGGATLALRQGDIPVAERYARESLAACEAIGDARGMAAALNLLGNAAFERNDYADAVTHHTASLALRREIGNRLGISASLHNLGRTARFQGEYARALRYYQEGEALYREIGHSEGLASALGNQGHMARDCGDPSGALPLIEESLALYERMGQKRGTGIALAQLAMIAHDTHDDTSARAYVERSMAIRQQIGDQWGIAQSLTILGDISHAAGDGGHAWHCYRDALVISRAIGNELGVVECLERLARLMAGRRMWTSAARCFGAARAVRERIHAPILPIDRPAIDRAVADARAALGDDLFVAACDAGRMMDMDEMVAEATRRPSPNGALRAE